MRVKLGSLRKLIREEIRDVLSPAKTDREPIGTLGKRTLEPECQEDGDLPFHLRDTDFDIEDYYGPVPPTAEDPYAESDPYATDTSVLPTSTIKRG